MQLFNKLFTTKIEYIPVPLDEPENILLNEISKDKTPTVQPTEKIILPVVQPTVMDFTTFLLACHEKKYDSIRDLASTNKTIIKTHISTCLSDHNVQTVDVIKIFLDISPDAIFKIVQNNNFGTIFPRIKDKIDPKVVDDNNRNFCYYMKNIDDIFQILESNMDFDINHVDICNATFITYLASNNRFKDESVTKLVDCLKKTKYNFNNISNDGRSILCLSLNATTSEKQYNQAKIIVQIPELDILIETTWLELLVKKNNQSYASKLGFENLIKSVLDRNDHESFLCRLIDKYLCEGAEKDLITICICVHKLNVKKFKRMITNVDPHGNTFVHYAARMHFKQLLNIIYLMIDINAIKPNTNSKTPIDLYRDGKITNIFSTTQK